MPEQVKHPRGHKPAPPHVLVRRHAAAAARHDHRIAELPVATQVKFDCRTAPGYVVMPLDDQGQCGDCFMISVLDCAAAALASVGVIPKTVEGRLSGQYGLDCHSNLGACDGGDEASVFDVLKSTGWVLERDYGPYQQASSHCKSITGMKIYKIDDWGYCTPSQEQGVAATQDIKNCMVQYGPISVAFDASECDGYTNGTMTGNGTGVDHAVLCIGWDDTHDNGDGSKGAFLGLNQWGSWGINGDGTFWVKYGADSFGTEAIWCTAGVLPVPPGPGPVPPGPVPPQPPAPIPFTVTIPAQVATLFGMPIVHVPGQTVTGVMGQSVTVGLPPWLLIALKAACNELPLLPDGWYKTLLTGLCGYLPKAIKESSCNGCK